MLSSMKVTSDGNELKMSFFNALKRMIQTLVTVLHLKVLVCQLNLNHNLMVSVNDDSLDGLPLEEEQNPDQMKEANRFFKRHYQDCI